MTRPRLIVFDLDFTLWDCGGTWCDCLSPPFRIDDHRVLDTRDSHVRIYDSIPGVFDWAGQHQIPMALASRTEQPRWAIELLQLLGLKSRFQWQQIFPDCKRTHFHALQQDSGIRFHDMLFFDDEQRNIRDVATLGVTCMHVPSGFSDVIFQQGLNLHASRPPQKGTQP